MKLSTKLAMLQAQIQSMKYSILSIEKIVAEAEDDVMAQERAEKEGAENGQDEVPLSESKMKLLFHRVNELEMNVYIIKPRFEALDRRRMFKGDTYRLRQLDRRFDGRFDQMDQDSDECWMHEDEDM